MLWEASEFPHTPIKIGEIQHTQFLKLSVKFLLLYFHTHKHLCNWWCVTSTKGKAKCSVGGIQFSYFVLSSCDLYTVPHRFYPKPFHTLVHAVSSWMSLSTFYDSVEQMFSMLIHPPTSIWIKIMSTAYARWNHTTNIDHGTPKQENVTPEELKQVNVLW